MTLRIALLRGINVGGNKKVPMAELRQLASDLGWLDAKTYIASGNLMYRSDDTSEGDETALEAAISEHFGFDVDVIVRSAERWHELAAGSAFPDAEQTREKFLHLGLSKSTPASDAVETLEPYLSEGEQLAALPDGLWIDYFDGVGRSKLTPARLDRAVGSTVTCRNWRSVQKLSELLRELA